MAFKLCRRKIKLLELIVQLKNNLKIIFLLSFFTFSTYLLEFYILFSDTQFFWCVSVKDFYIYNDLSIRLPIHCDEGPYQLASSSIEYFYSKENPYQARPFYISFISLINKLVQVIMGSVLTKYQIFKISIFIVQILIIFLIIKLLIILLNLRLTQNIDFLILLSFLLIPNIRWNVFFPSHGNLTFLFLLLTMVQLTNKKIFLKDSNFFLALGALSLFHTSSIVYGLIYFLIKCFKVRRINLEKIISLGYMSIFQIIYRFSYVYLNKEPYDWHREVYGQFYWIIDLLKGKPTRFCQDWNTFLVCNFKFTFDFLMYFLVLAIFFLCLLFVNKYLNLNWPIHFDNLLYLSLGIYIFWAFQGYYSFRFINYSIGYFLYIGIILFSTSIVKKNYLLLFSLIFYHFSVDYLEPYSVINPQINIFTFFSIILFVIFVYVNTFNKSVKSN